jgi:hypothetical protein
MTTLSDIYTAITTYHSSHGYPPDTIHITIEQLAYLIATIPTTLDINYVTDAKLYGCNLVISDTFAIEGTPTIK